MMIKEKTRRETGSPMYIWKKGSEMGGVVVAKHLCKQIKQRNQIADKWMAALLDGVSHNK